MAAPNTSHVNDYIKSVLPNTPTIGTTAIVDLMFKVFGVDLVNTDERAKAHPYIEDMIAVALFMGKRFPTSDHYTTKYYPEILKACIDVFGKFMDNREAIAVYALMLTQYGFYRQMVGISKDEQNRAQLIHNLLTLFRDSFTEPTWKQYLGVVYTVRKGLSDKDLLHIDFNRREEYSVVSRIWANSGSETMRSVALMMSTGYALDDIERVIDNVADSNILHSLVLG